jgi:L-ribulose-5-phosphate 4-epimerase
MTEEGYIKFRLEWEETSLTDLPDLRELNTIRTKLHDLGLIGVLPDGIGFGNISIRISDNKFIISGTQTGHLRELSEKHYALVDDFSIDVNLVKCTGETKASSESMTHAAIYSANININSVIHVHNKPLWEKLIDVEKTTDPKIEYGTPELAREVESLVINSFRMPHGIIILGGHEDGILVFADNIENAARLLIERYSEKKYIN